MRTNSVEKSSQMGQGLVELALLLALISGVVFMSLKLMGDTTAGIFEHVIVALGGNPNNAPNTDITVTALDAGNEGIANVLVYVFDEQGTYLNLFGQTDLNGETKFTLDSGNYLFLAHHQLGWFWSEPVAYPQQNLAQIHTGQRPFLVTVADAGGTPISDVPIYAYTVDDQFMGVQGTTNGNGQLNLNLVDRDLKFRADYNSGVYWSDNIPAGSSSAHITINSCPDGQFLAEYYNNSSLSGAPVLIRCEDVINNNWGSNAPAPGVNKNLFSIRWTGRFGFTNGQHTFTTTADDGVRVWVDGGLELDKWKLQGATTYTFKKNLSSGTHSIKIEYFENYGRAVAKFSWN